MSAGPAQLEPLLEEGVIQEIIGRLKSGKEADIYLVQHAGQVVAAKVYKDAGQRSFKNNAEYKEGRGERSSRTRRAIETGSRFGRKAQESAWRTTEVDALRLLHAAGVRVPAPVLFYEGVLLMQLVTVGEEGQAAPRLIDTAFSEADARPLYLELRRQLIQILCCGLVHGDLSPYNILAASTGPTIIDFPQVVSVAHNSRAEFFFQRDFKNLLDFVVGLDKRLKEPHLDDGRAIWRAYLRGELGPDFVPPVSVPRPPRPQQHPAHAPRPQQHPAHARPQQHPAHAPRPQQHPAHAPRPQQRPVHAPRPQHPQPHGRPGHPAQPARPSHAPHPSHHAQESRPPEAPRLQPAAFGAAQQGGEATPTTPGRRRRRRRRR